MDFCAGHSLGRVCVSLSLSLAEDGHKLAHCGYPLAPEMPHWRRIDENLLQSCLNLPESEPLPPSSKRRRPFAAGRPRLNLEAGSRLWLFFARPSHELDCCIGQQEVLQEASKECSKKCSSLELRQKKRAATMSVKSPLVAPPRGLSPVFLHQSHTAGHNPFLHSTRRPCRQTSP